MGSTSIHCVPLVESAVHPPLLVWLLAFCLIQYFSTGAFMEEVLNACLWTTEGCLRCILPFLPIRKRRSRA